MVSCSARFAQGRRARDRGDSCHPADAGPLLDHDDQLRRSVPRSGAPGIARSGPEIARIASPWTADQATNSAPRRASASIRPAACHLVERVREQLERIAPGVAPPPSRALRTAQVGGKEERGAEQARLGAGEADVAGTYGTEAGPGALGRVGVASHASVRPRSRAPPRSGRACRPRAAARRDRRSAGRRRSPSRRPGGSPRAAPLPRGRPRAPSRARRRSARAAGRRGGSEPDGFVAGQGPSSWLPPRPSVCIWCPHQASRHRTHRNLIRMSKTAPPVRRTGETPNRRPAKETPMTATERPEPARAGWPCMSCAPGC